MAIDTHSYRRKLRGKKASVNLIPLIDVIFTILIFLMVTSSFQAVSDSGSGKPQMSQGSGNSEYYLIPVAGLKIVTVNGVDMSQDIRNSAIAVHKNVIDEGEIIIRPKQNAIIITSPNDIPPEQAVRMPKT